MREDQFWLILALLLVWGLITCGVLHHQLTQDRQADRVVCTPLTRGHDARM